MKPRRNLGVAALLCAFGVVGAGAGSASAATTNSFGCPASTAVATLGSTNLLPGATNANPANTPCASDQQLLAATTINPAGLNLVSATVGPVSAATTLSRAQADGSAIDTGAMATSTVDALDLDVLSAPISRSRHRPPRRSSTCASTTCSSPRTTRRSTRSRSTASRFR